MRTFAGMARPKARARPKPTPGAMNATEAAYAALLQARLAAGEIAHFAFEPLKLRLAAKTFYTPDFLVLLPDGAVELHEVKGFWEEDARVKVKVAAAQFWWLTLVAVRRDGRGWAQEVF
ncbi:MAG: DUF1064 domain-containing protein [Aeromonas sp.]